jgi:hypothetical protein
MYTFGRELLRSVKSLNEFLVYQECINYLKKKECTYNSYESTFRIIDVNNFKAHYSCVNNIRS